jgi:hypothetical protein
MAQQGKQMRVGAREGFAYHSVKLVLVANGNRYEVDSNTLFLTSPLSIKYCHLPTLTFFFLTNIHICSLWKRAPTLINEKGTCLSLGECSFITANQKWNFSPSSHQQLHWPTQDIYEQQVELGTKTFQGNFFATIFKHVLILRQLARGRWVRGETGELSPILDSTITANRIVWVK